MGAPAVVIVGAGHAGLETAAALRSQGHTGRITLVGEERTTPYERPPLSKGYLAGTVDEEALELRPQSFFAAQDIEFLPGDRVVEIDREARTVLLRSGQRLPYGRLVLATGARPRSLPVPGSSLAGVHALRDIEDAQVLRRRLAAGRRLQLVVVGAGFIGLELASTARRLGHDVTVVEALHRVMARSVSVPVSAHLTREHREQGTRVLLRREVTALHGDSSGHVQVVELDGVERLPADVVVVGVGVLPNTGPAADAGLHVGDGIMVDGLLRTSDRPIHAIGDCARFPSPHAARHVRLESVHNASAQARHVAAVICGETRPYTAVPWFWSEQCGLRLQIAGLTSAQDRTVMSGDPATGRFSVFCFRDDRLTAVESVNRPADHGISRRLLASGTSLSPEEAGRPGFDLRHHRFTGTEERAVHA